jgi:hypothetical protein
MNAIALGVATLACTSGGAQQTYDDGEPSGATSESTSTTTPAEETVTPENAAIQPSAQAVARAQAAGIPAIDPNGVPAAGPFEGPGGTLLYIGKDAKLTFYQPDQAIAYFGTQTPNGITYQYVLALTGQYVVDANNQAVQVQALPDDSLTWPHAQSVAQVFIATLQAIQAGQRAAPQGGGQADWASMSAASKAMHDTNMSIINNMGSTGCTKHYDDVYYLGCW